MESRIDRAARILCGEEDLFLNPVSIGELAVVLSEKLEVSISTQQVHQAIGKARHNPGRYGPKTIPYANKGRLSRYVTDNPFKLPIQRNKRLIAKGKRSELSKRLTAIRRFFYQVRSEAEREPIGDRKDLLETERDGWASQYQLVVKSLRRELREEIAYWRNGWTTHPTNTLFDYKDQEVLTKSDRKKNIRATERRLKKLN